MPTDESRAHAALTRYWDDLIHHRSPRPDDLDPLVTATVQRLHTLDDAPAPDAVFLTRLRGELLASPSPLGSNHRPLGVATTPNGRTTRGDDSPRPRRRSSPKRWWPPLEFAAAITLLVTLVGGYFAGDRVLPLLSGTAPTEETAPPAEIGTTSLISLDIDSVPGVGPVTVRLLRVTVQPNNGWSAENLSLTFPAQFSYYVEQGTMNLDVKEPGATDPLGSSYVVRSGQALNVVGDTVPSILNFGESPLVVLQLGIYRGAESPLRAGPGVSIVDLGGGVAEPWPDEPVRLTLDRVGVEVGDAIHLAGEGAPLLISVESGWLGFTVEEGKVELPHLPIASGDVTPEASTSPADISAAGPTATPDPVAAQVVAGNDVTLEAGDAAFVPTGAVIAGLHNAWNTPLSALVVRIEAGIEGPAESAEGLPVASRPIEDVATGRFDARPGHLPIGLVLRRLKLEPGASLDEPFSGTVLHFVESGTVSIRLGGEPSGEALVSAGQEHHATGDGPLVVHNAGSATTQVVQALVFAGSGFAEPSDGSLPEGVSATLLGSTAVESLQSSPYDVRLSRVTLPGLIGQNILPVRSPIVELIAVDSGTLAVMAVDDFGEFGGPATEAESLLTPGGAASVQRGGSYSAWNPDDVPVTAYFLSMAFAPEASPSGPPVVAGELADPIVPSAEECRVAPRSIEELEPIMIQPRSELAKADQGLWRAIAWGSPANPETVAGVSATIREVAACVNAGQALQVYALYSDNGINVAAGIFGRGLLDLGGNGFPRTDFYVTDVREYEDGRAGAWVLSGGEWNYVTFVRSGDRWLIDAIFLYRPRG